MFFNLELCVDSAAAENPNTENQKAIMTPEEQMRQDVRDIKLAVIGDEKLGTSGLVSRVRRLERKQHWFELRVASFLGGVIVLWEGAKIWIESIKQR